MGVDVECGCRSPQKGLLVRSVDLLRVVIPNHLLRLVQPGNTEMPLSVHFLVQGDGVVLSVVVWDWYPRVRP